ncbi:MAG: phosphoribosylamine--glycine ligase [Elusimicrobiales bacterium]
MNILLIGSGGREHAVAWKLAQSPSLGTLYCAPSSAAIAELAQTAPVDAEDFAAVADFCAGKSVDLVFVGPEAPLAAGIADFLRARGIAVFGPGREGALLEASKSRAKQFMLRYGIPTAAARTFDDAAAAKAAVMESPLPVVVKADGLAAGKGVRVCFTREDALAAVSDFMEKKIFGGAGARAVLEEFMTGSEASAMAFCDGKKCLPLPLARDHKRLLDGDKGPNTGGMGACCPLPDVDSKTKAAIASIFDGFLRGIAGDGIDYRGVIYAGLMLTPQGPKVVEFNCRLGDPETQCLLPMLDCDLAAAAKACADGNLPAGAIPVKSGACAAVVLAARGYPDSPEKGKIISGLENAARLENTALFHAGTAKTADGWVTAGGRVLAASALGADLPAAIAAAYRAAAEIRFDGMQYRGDIGLWKK